MLDVEMEVEMSLVFADEGTHVAFEVTGVLLLVSATDFCLNIHQEEANPCAKIPLVVLQTCKLSGATKDRLESG